MDYKIALMRDKIDKEGSACEELRLAKEAAKLKAL